MRNIFLLSTILLVLHVNLSLGQTASDIVNKYGKPINVYSVSEHIWMSSEYGVNGQVCKMWVHPKSFAGDTNYIGTQLPFEELKAVLNQLVPGETRGNKKSSFGSTATGGGAAWTTYSYEKVTFVFVSPFKLQGASGIRPYQFSERVSSPSKKDPTMPEDEFMPSQGFPTQIVTITWNDRRCTAQ